MTRILLALSGGIDSMYMANRASELYPEAFFAVAHCNFCLRGKESDSDEEFVSEWCRVQHLECHLRRFDTSKFAQERGISIEMAARELRYAWFAQLCESYGYEAVAVAHNANDNAETLLLNLLRGTGSRGIRGMSSESIMGNIRLLRPLLTISRAQILEWMQSNGHTWREDSTNAISDCRRNIIRNDVFPLFAQLNPSFVRTLNSDMQRFAQVDDIAQDYFESVSAKVLDASGAILVSELMGLKHWRFVLWKLLENCAITQDEFSSLVDCLSSARQIAGKRFGAVVGASGKLLIVKAETESIGNLRWELVPRSAISSLKVPKGVLLADADKLELPLRVRTWRDGDWLRPLGMNGRKKISDLMTNLKWTVIQKSKAQVIELDGSHVAALLCERIDDSVKVSDSTVRVIRISYLYDIG